MVSCFITQEKSLGCLYFCFIGGSGLNFQKVSLYKSWYYKLWESEVDIKDTKRRELRSHLGGGTWTLFESHSGGVFTRICALPPPHPFNYLESQTRAPPPKARVCREHGGTGAGALHVGEELVHADPEVGVAGSLKILGSPCYLPPPHNYSNLEVTPPPAPRSTHTHPVLFCLGQDLKSPV